MRETEAPAGSPLDDHNSLDWASLKPEARSQIIFWISHSGSQGPKHMAYLLLLFQAISKQLDWKWRS